MTSVHGKCLVCGVELSSPVSKCANCDTLHHPECSAYNGERCAIYGCGGTTTVAPTPVPSTPRPIPPVVRAIRRDNDMISLLLGIVIITMVIGSGSQIVFDLFSFGRIPVNAGEIVFDQSEQSGDRVLTEGQFYYPDGNKTIRYKKSSSFRFHNIPVRFGDHVMAEITGSIYYDMPRDKNQLQTLFSFYSSQRNLEDRMIRSVVTDAANEAARTMTYAEVKSGRYQDFMDRIREQIRNGGYNPSLFNACGFGLDGIYITDITHHY